MGLSAAVLCRLIVKQKRFTMNDLKVFLLATTGTLFMQAVEPLRLDYRPENTTEMLLRAGLSLLVGIVTTLTFKVIENTKVWQRLVMRHKKTKTTH
jgi:hypothetical protein